MALNATIDLTVKKPDFKSMKSEIRELTVAAQQAVMQFGEFSPEAVRAEQALAGARDRMDDFNDRVKAVNPDKFAKLNTVVMGVANGFQAAQGAMALFGNESKDFEKTMIKLQGAMALTQGLEGLGKVQQQFTAIFTDIASGAKKAFAAIRAGIGSTGIGLIVVALGSIVAYWDEIKTAIMGVSEETKKAKVEQDKYNQSIRDLNRERELLLYGELASKKSELAEIEAKQNQIGEDYIKIQQRLKIIAQSRALAGVEHGKAEEAQLRLTLQANTLKSEQLVNDEIRTRQAIRRIEENDAAKKLADAEKAKQQRKTAQAEEDARLKAIQDGKDLVNAQNKKHEEDLFKELNTIRGAGLFKQGEQLKTYTDEEYILLAAAAARRKALEEKTKADTILTEQQISDAKLSIAQSTVEGLTALNVILTAEDQKRQNIQKAIALVEIGIDTAIAVSSLNAESAKASAKVAGVLGPATPIFTAAYYAQGIVRILANVAKAKQVLSGGKASGGGGGGAMGINAPAMSAPNISSSLPTVSGFDTKVFVTEGDIRRTTDRVDTTRKVSVVK
jgi:hypothetical protein